MIALIETISRFIDWKHRMSFNVYEKFIKMNLTQWRSHNSSISIAQTMKEKICLKWKEFMKMNIPNHVVVIELKVRY